MDLTRINIHSHRQIRNIMQASLLRNRIKSRAALEEMRGDRRVTAAAKLRLPSSSSQSKAASISSLPSRACCLSPCSTGAVYLQRQPVFNIVCFHSQFRQIPTARLPGSYCSGIDSSSVVPSIIKQSIAEHRRPCPYSGPRQRTRPGPIPPRGPKPLFSPMNLRAQRPLLPSSPMTMGRGPARRGTTNEPPDTRS